MAALVCDICGGKLVVQSGGIAKCDSCGMEYTKERIQEKVQEIKGTVNVDGPVETVKGDAEKERLLNMANDCLNKGNLDEARRIYTTVSKEYSNDWRGWWGIICSTPLIENNVVALIGEKETYLNHEFEMALSFCPDKEKDKIYKNKVNRFKKIEKIKIQNQIDNLQKENTQINSRLKEINVNITSHEENIKFQKKKSLIFAGVYLLIILVFLISESLSNWWLLLIVPFGGVVVLALLLEKHSDIYYSIDKKSFESLKSKLDENNNKLKTLNKELERIN